MYSVCELILILETKVVYLRILQQLLVSISIDQQRIYSRNYYLVVFDRSTQKTKSVLNLISNLDVFWL